MEDIERQVSELLDRVSALEAMVMQSHAVSAPVAETMVAPPATPGPTFQPVTSPAQAQVPVQEAVYSPSPPAGHQPPPPNFSPQGPVNKPVSFEWGIETVLRWAGVVLVSLAGIFLVSTAISRGWIGPELQLFGAALAGVGLLGGAVRLAAERREWSLALGCGGAVVLAASALATHGWLDVVGPGVAAALLAAVTVAAIAIAMHIRIEGIALTATVVGMLAPLDTLSDFGDGTILTWVVAFIIGSSALGLAKTWPGVRLITGWLGALVLLAYAVSEDAEGAMRTGAFLGSLIVGAILWAGPSIAHRLSPTNSPGKWGHFDWKAVDYRMAAFVPAWVWAVVAGVFYPVEDQTVGLIAIVTALAFGSLAAGMWALIPRLVSISTIFGALSLLAVGLAIFLDGPALMIALAGQAVTSYYLSRQLNDGSLEINAYVVGFVSTAMAAYEMLEALDNDGFSNAGYTLGTLLLVLGWVAAALLAYRRHDLDIPFGIPFVGAWGGTMLWLAAALIAVPQGLVLISVAWAVMACVGLVFGLMQRSNIIKNVAMGTLGLTLFKLVTLDMAEVDVFWRVGLFFVVGMGLIALGLKVPSLIGPPPAAAAVVDEAPPANPVTTF